ncbi:unnamed protein product [Polarella glacialis]|uniref:TRAM domain-containing protein n=1 Tax=Polarella glacialis TaxID=89957 RepID=A0A813HF17_POLGL|nr:unnamed protein product [Polarella glacialis]
MTSLTPTLSRGCDWFQVPSQPSVLVVGRLPRRAALRVLECHGPRAAPQVASSLRSAALGTALASLPLRRSLRRKLRGACRSAQQEVSEAAATATTTTELVLEEEMQKLGLDADAQAVLLSAPLPAALEILAACREAAEAAEVRNPSAFVVARVRKLQADQRPQPPAEGSRLQLRVSKVLSHGQGLGFWGESEWVIMVGMGVLAGELVEVCISRNFKRYSEAQLISVLESSPDRVQPKCPLFGQCSGCQYQHASYEAQLALKREHVSGTLRELSGLELPSDIVELTVRSPQEYHYRNKITPKLEAVSAKHGGDGDLLQPDGCNGPIGFCEQEWGHEQDASGRRWRGTVDIAQCPLASAAINAQLPAAREALRVRAAEALGKLRSPAARRSLARRRRSPLVALLRATTLDGVVQSWEEVATETIAEVGTFKFRAGNFFQVNSPMLPIFVTRIVGLAAEPLQGGDSLVPEVLVDLYCGVGVFAIAASRHFQRVFGIELDGGAIELARGNAVANGAGNVSFQACDAGDGLSALLAASGASEEALRGERSVVIVDPPREGLLPVASEALLDWGPQRIVYVSCDPATQARDLKELTAKGNYVVKRIVPFDMFPQTRHVESVVVLERRMRAE